MSRDAFGPNLRRIRVQRQISVEQIAEATKVSPDLYYGLEKNDFSRWPKGLHARAFIRQYAEAIGVDGDATVDEFCRWFTHGDRRAHRLVREQAQIVGHHDLEWQDVPPEQGDRRGTSSQPSKPAAEPSLSPLATWFVRVRRVLGRA